MTARTASPRSTMPEVRCTEQSEVAVVLAFVALTLKYIAVLAVVLGFVALTLIYILVRIWAILATDPTKAACKKGVTTNPSAIGRGRNHHTTYPALGVKDGVPAWSNAPRPDTYVTTARGE